MSHLVRLRGKDTVQTAHSALLIFWHLIGQHSRHMISLASNLKPQYLEVLLRLGPGVQPDTYLHFIGHSIFHCFPTCISSPHTPSYLPTYLTTHLPYYLPVFYWAQYLPLFSNVYSLTSSTTSSRICLPVEQHRMTNSNVNASCISWAGVWFFGGQHHWSVTLCLK